MISSRELKIVKYVFLSSFLHCERATCVQIMFLGVILPLWFWLKVPKLDKHLNGAWKRRYPSLAVTEQKGITNYVCTWSKIGTPVFKMRLCFVVWKNYLKCSVLLTFQYLCKKMNIYTQTTPLHIIISHAFFPCRIVSHPLITLCIFSFHLLLFLKMVIASWTTFWMNLGVMTSFIFVLIKHLCVIKDNTWTWPFSSLFIDNLLGSQGLRLPKRHSLYRKWLLWLVTLPCYRWDFFL